MSEVRLLTGVQGGREAAGSFDLYSRLLLALAPGGQPAGYITAIAGELYNHACEVSEQMNKKASEGVPKPGEVIRVMGPI